MNPSYECMRAREESRAELLEMRRWDVSRRLNALELGEGSHENLSVIANVIYEPKFGWTKGACAYLRDQLVELIGGERDAQRGCSDGITITNGEHEVRIVKDDVVADGISVVDIINDTINKALRGQSRICPESERWREKCAKLEEENRGLKAALSCLEVDFKRIRSLASQIIDHTHDKETAANE